MIKIASGRYKFLNFWQNRTQYLYFRLTKYELVIRKPYFDVKHPIVTASKQICFVDGREQIKNFNCSPSLFYENLHCTADVIYIQPNLKWHYSGVWWARYSLSFSFCIMFWNNVTHCKMIIKMYQNIIYSGVKQHHTTIWILIWREFSIWNKDLGIRGKHFHRQTIAWNHINKTYLFSDIHLNLVEHI